jgi:hypothetical protein
MIRPGENRRRVHPVRLIPALMAMLVVLLVPAAACVGGSPPMSACPMGGSSSCCCAGTGVAVNAPNPEPACAPKGAAVAGCAMRPGTGAPSAYLLAVTIPFQVDGAMPALRPETPRLPLLLAWRPFACVKGTGSDSSPPPLPARAPPAMAL